MVVVTYLREGKNLCAVGVRKKSEKTMKETDLRTPRERRRLFKCQSRDAPAACVEDDGEAGHLPAGSGGSHWNR